MNEIIKSKTKKTKNNLIFNQYIQNEKVESNFVFLETLITEINELISTTNSFCYENLAKKLNNRYYKQKQLVTRSKNL